MARAQQKKAKRPARAARGTAKRAGRALTKSALVPAPSRKKNAASEPPTKLEAAMVLDGDPDREGAPGTARGKYAYCIIRSSESLSFGTLGLGAEPSQVYTISYRDLAAVVSDSAMGGYDATRENLLAHQRVNETVMREHTVLPIAFGTVFKTRDDVIEL